MIKGIIILACCLPLAVSATENQAITDTNFQADLAYSTSEYFDHVILTGIENLPQPVMPGHNIIFIIPI